MINLRPHFRAANDLGRASRTASAAATFAPHSLQSAARSLPRRGISLLEVLISMFVLLFGLMGVASIFPVGNHYAGKGEQFDRGSALAESAFADLKARGMLKPELWLYADDPQETEASPLTATDPVTNRKYIYPKRGPLVLQHPYSPIPGSFNVTDPSTHPGYAFVIDPLSTAEGLDVSSTITAGLDYFPIADLSTGALNSNMPPAWSSLGLSGERWPIRRLTLPIPDPAAPANTTSIIPLTSAVAETIFRLHDDVTNELPKESDRPGIQRWTAVDSRAGTPNNTPNDPSDDTLLARSYTGNYSWLATVVPTSVQSLSAIQPINSRFGSDLYEVSVAVFNKRETIPPSAATERLIEAQMLQGNELLIYGTNSDPDLAIENVNNAAEGIRAGNWIAVAGVHPTTGAFLLKWYRILSIDDETQENQQIYDNNGSLTGNYPVRRAMLDGPDWPLPKLAGGGVRPDITPRAILLPGVISVATQMLPMESAQ